MQLSAYYTSNLLTPKILIFSLSISKKLNLLAIFLKMLVLIQQYIKNKYFIVQTIASLYV